MKLVNFEEFCKMPAGTIFAPYTPCVLEEELAIKVDEGEDMPESYPYCRHTFNGVMPLQPWMGDAHDNLWNIGDQAPASFEVYDGDNNDYMDYKMFLVFEELDIDRMINALIWAKNGCVGECYCDANDSVENITKNPWNSVHCKDCRYYSNGKDANGDTRYFCDIPGRTPVFRDPDDFCQYGRRKDS